MSILLNRTATVTPEEHAARIRREKLADVRSEINILVRAGKEHDAHRAEVTLSYLQEQPTDWWSEHAGQSGYQLLGCKPCDGAQCIRLVTTGEACVSRMSHGAALCRPCQNAVDARYRAAVDCLEARRAA